jgi:hypothetical protein
MRGLKCEFTLITPPKRLTHVMNTLEKGRTKREAIEKEIFEEDIYT